MTAINARPVKAVVNRSALVHNLNRVRQLAPRSRVMSVVKANAYGHGILEVAKVLSASDAFAVASIDEALYLREQQIELPIFLLEGFFTQEQIEYCIHHKLIPIVHSFEQLAWLKSYARQNAHDIKTLKLWVKLDTGMHRLGFIAEQWPTVLKQLKDVCGKDCTINVASHFASADDKSAQVNKQQLQLFTRITDTLNGEKSMANSAAILANPPAHMDWVRPGIMLYGVSPFLSGIGAIDGLQAVMHLSSAIIAVKELKKGDCVGYGCDWRCPQDMPVGVVAIGYGDGYPRHAESGTPVLVNGVVAPLIGRESMDMISIDLRPLKRLSKQVRVGDSVTLWGEQLPIENIARKSSTIGYELLCQITKRVPFEYV